MKRGYLYAALAVVCVWLVFLWRGCRKHDRAVDTQIKSTTLAPTESAKVIVDPRRHTVTTVTRTADGRTDTRATYLPPSGASISVGKNGSVLVTTRSWGTEISPFVGVALGSDIRGRASLGLNLFYVQRWEMGGGLLLNTDIRDTRLFAHVSYNVYGNYYVSVGADNRRTAHLMAGLKF